jgi:hypothetical protein
LSGHLAIWARSWAPMLTSHKSSNTGVKLGSSEVCRASCFNSLFGGLVDLQGTMRK